MGAGDPGWMRQRPVNEDMPLAGDVNFKKLPSGSPEALLELLNKDNNQMFRGNMGSIDREEDLLMQKFNKQRPKYERGVTRRKVPIPKFGDPDPSVADSIAGQQFDVEDKGLAADNNGDHMPFYGKKSLLNGRSNNQVSVVPDDLLQLHHGRMSMDSANVISHFFKEPQYRSNIPGSLAQRKLESRAVIKKQKVGNGTIVGEYKKNLVDDGIQLEVNGSPLYDHANVRSNIRNAGGKFVNGHARTIKSKGPIQIELRHDAHAHKIVNIITNSKFNVTSDSRKRTNIPRDTIPKRRTSQPLPLLLNQLKS